MKIQFLIHILIGIISIAVLPTVRALVPPPDGGYPGGNTAEGQKALFSLTTGSFNTAVGLASLQSGTIISYNTAVGAGSLFLNTADNNTATGVVALFNNTTGDVNTANGTFALFHNTTGFDNTATGDLALYSNIDGSLNTANGGNALIGNTTGNGNTAIGFGALDSNSTGNDNIALGVAAGFNVETADNVICIGNAGADVSDSCYIGNIWGQSIDPGTALTVGVDENGKVGTTASSRRFKHDIKQMGKSSETLLALKPVTFHYKSDTKATPQFGLIAEEVAEMNPDLVVRDKEGKPFSVRYDQVNAMLLNEFLKDHRKGEQQDLAISQLKSALAQQQKTFESNLAQQEQQVAELTANLQRLAADIELNKSESRTVAEK